MIPRDYKFKVGDIVQRKKTLVKYRVADTDGWNVTLEPLPGEKGARKTVKWATAVRWEFNLVTK